MGDAPSHESMQWAPPLAMLTVLGRGSPQRVRCKRGMAASLRYVIEHASRYRYAAPATACVMSLRLRPFEDERQRVVAFTIEADPTAPLECTVDGFGNAHHLLALHREHDALAVTARATVEVHATEARPNSIDPLAWTTLHGWADGFDHWEFLRPSALARGSPALDAFVAERGLEPGDDPLGSVTALSDAIHDGFTYAPGATTVESPINHILESRRGVCQDYAHVMIAIARSWGVPARYVSGYLHVAGHDRPAGLGNATHAWVECLLPGLGWVGLDPTNRGFAGAGHIRIAVGRDYRDVSPTRGVRQGGGEATLEVGVRVHATEASSR